MAYYLATRFQRGADITSSMPPKAQLTQKMQDDMNYVEANNGNANGGKWFLAKCLSLNGTDSPKAIGEYYTVYYPTHDGTIVTNLKTVAAPCPPFCQDETGASVEQRLNIIESKLEDLLKGVNKLLQKGD